MPSPNARGYFCLTLGHGTRTGRKERGGGQRSTHQDAFVKAVVPMERAPQRYSTLPGMHAGSAWFARMLDYQQAHVRTPAMILAPLGACPRYAVTQRHVLNLVCVHTTGHRTTNNIYIYIYHQDLQMFLIDTPDSGLKFFIKERV